MGEDYRACGYLPMTSALTRLSDFFATRGFICPDIALLQPAEPFLDTAGERMRGQIFMTSDRRGNHLCLRPEFTIPVCLEHLRGARPDGKYAYGGVVFRQGNDNDTAIEFIQAGVEFIGGESSRACDVECIALALDALGQIDAKELKLFFGDQAVFEALLEALDLPPAWQARLGRAFGDRDKLASDLHLMAERNGWSLDNIDAPLRKALEDNNGAQVEQLISLRMKQGNLPVSGGRTASDIARRLMTKAELTTSQLSDNQRRILSGFLQLDVPLERAQETLDSFAREARIDIREAIAKFSTRTDLLLEGPGRICEIRWQAGFGRSLDYYTGIVFEIFLTNQKHPVCGGGRYDHLMEVLGAKENVPAIGFSIWLDRLQGGAS